MADEETDYARARARMVKRQIAARGIKSSSVLEVMRRVPRHRFIPMAMRCRAYDDCPVPIGLGQTISQPYIVAIMTELLDLCAEDHVLEVGAGSGYQAAILAEIAASVVTVERQSVLAQRARELLAELGYDNVTVVEGDGTLGRPVDAPYDAIIVTAGGPSVPRTLRDQLAMGGRLVCPTGSREIQGLVKVVRTPSGFDATTGIRCTFVPLIGVEGWRDAGG